MGLARNLRSLQWFDKVDMNTFFPRMYNLANPWEMQDFVEDFIFTAAHAELIRFTRQLCVTAAIPPEPTVSKSGKDAASETKTPQAAAAAADGGAGAGAGGVHGADERPGARDKAAESGGATEWRGGTMTEEESRGILEAAYEICEAFLDNRRRLFVARRHPLSDVEPRAPARRTLRRRIPEPAGNRRLLPRPPGAR